MKTTAMITPVPMSDGWLLQVHTEIEFELSFSKNIGSVHNSKFLLCFPISKLLYVLDVWPAVRTFPSEFSD